MPPIHGRYRGHSEVSIINTGPFISARTPNPVRYRGHSQPAYFSTINELMTSKHIMLVPRAKKNRSQSPNLQAQPCTPYKFTTVSMDSSALSVPSVSLDERHFRALDWRLDTFSLFIGTSSGETCRQYGLIGIEVRAGVVRRCSQGVKTNPNHGHPSR